jgi:hypothetical protein
MNKRLGRPGITFAVGLALAIAVLMPASTYADDDSVVVSRPGVVFHKAGSGDVRGRGHEKPLADAIAAGYSPCKVCFGKQQPVNVNAAGARGPSPTATASTSFGLRLKPGVGLPTVTQPFGLSQGHTKRISGASRAIKNPYSHHNLSQTFRGRETGAYGGRR